MTNQRTLGARLLSIEHTFRAHPRVVGMVAVAVLLLIYGTKVGIENEASLALTYVIPVALVSYSAGFAFGAMMSLAASVLWVFDATEFVALSGVAAWAFTVRFVTDLGVAGIAALGSMAARTRERYLAEQQDLVRLRTDLVSAFTHDLRTPLAVISGYAEILRGELPDSEFPTARDALDRILVNVGFLDRMTRDMMSAQRAEAVIAMEPSRFTPEELVADLQAQFLRKPDASVSLQWRIEPGVPALQTDRGKLTSVVRNLVSNALKFTTTGSVTVRIAYETPFRRHRIEVEDTGPGIPQESLPLIFDRFYRGGSSEPARGFGFGLFIVKKFTEMLGGTVAVTSELGRGTRFVTTLPGLEVSRTHGDVPAK